MTIIEDNGKLEVKSIKTALRLATPLSAIFCIHFLYKMQAGKPREILIQAFR